MATSRSPLSSQLSREWSFNDNNENEYFSVVPIENLPSKRVPSGIKYKYYYTTANQLLMLEPVEIIQLDINTIDPKLISDKNIFSTIQELNKTKDKKKRGTALNFLKIWSEKNIKKEQRLQKWIKRLKEQTEEEEESEGIVSEAFLSRAPKLSSMSLPTAQDIELRRRLEKLKLKGGRKTKRFNKYKQTKKNKQTKTKHKKSLQKRNKKSHKHIMLK